MMDDLLQQLNRVRGVGGSVLLSAEGLPIAAALREGVDETRLSAAAGTLMESAARLGRHLGLGAVGTLTTADEQGALLLIAAGKAWLAVVIDPAANLALLQLEARPFVERIAQRLSL
jgi:predicted regulator of Ras-like GTPase activity (Roadblock/LC7/MglB family)